MSAFEDGSLEFRLLEGTVEQVRHHNEEDGWTVARLRVANGHGGDNLVTVVGCLADAREGIDVKLWGDWTTHPVYGDQFRFIRYQINRPMTPAALHRFLTAGGIKGIGPVLAKAIVERFGEEVIRIFDEEPDKLALVHGISKKKARAIGEEWRKQRGDETQTALMQLQGMGLSSAQAIRLHKHYGEEAVAVVERNPYQLALEVEGMGFKTADQIARTLGLATNSSFRLQAGITHSLQEAAQQGHCFLPKEVLLEQAVQLLECDDRDGLEQALQVLCDGGLLQVEEKVEVHLALDRPSEEVDEAIYLPRLWRAEREVARHLRRLQQARPETRPVEESLSIWLEGDRRIGEAVLSQQQAEAVKLALTEKVLALTGGPGVGKTTVTRAIVDLFEDCGCTVALASPTGRAAKRLSEVTGRPAKTIHRLLEIDPVAWEFRRNENYPLEADVIIVDESSMLDIELTWALVRAIPDAGRIIFVGDVDQLPSVGPGLVLRDLINSKLLAVARLSEIFRQDRESRIVMNAYHVNAGRVPEFLLPPRLEEDCLFITETDPNALVKRIVELVGKELPGQGFLPQDIQVLTPMNKRGLGTIQLNTILQAALNPARQGVREATRGTKIIREGDRVVQIVNNYTKEVFNGDVGTVLAVDGGARTIAVQYLDRTVWYDFEELDELELAYALTVHKAQGSEYPVVLLVCHTSQYIMLQRNLLYTGLTRAQRKCLLIGNWPAIMTAVRNNRPARRYTRLRELLSSGWSYDGEENEA